MQDTPPQPDPNEYRRADGGVDWVAFRAAASAWAAQAGPPEPAHGGQDDVPDSPVDEPAGA